MTQMQIIFRKGVVPKVHLFKGRGVILFFGDKFNQFTKKIVYRHTVKLIKAGAELCQAQSVNSQVG